MLEKQKDDKRAYCIYSCSFVCLKQCFLCLENGMSERINNLFRTYNHMLASSQCERPEGNTKGLGNGGEEQRGSQFISNHLQLSACLGMFFFFLGRGTKSRYTQLFSLAS